MKNLAKIALGIVTSIGGYLEAGSLGTSLQAGADFGYGLLWALAAGTVCLALLSEMTGRLAAASHHTVVDAMRKRFGFTFQFWPFSAQVVVDLLVLAAEIAGAAYALQLATGVSMAWWTLPVVAVIWIVLWIGTFGLIENGIAVLGLVTLSFVAAAWRLGPDWSEVGRGLIPHLPGELRAHYGYLAVSILGATMSPYLITFYSSGAVEEKWSRKDLAANRIVSTVGMWFGSLIALSAVAVAAFVLAPRGIRIQTYADAAFVLTSAFGPVGFWLFVASLFVGCLGAAFEQALDASYLVAQTFGWNWGKNQKPKHEARFSLVFTVVLILASVPGFLSVDPLTFTMFSMSVAVLALPLVVGPLLVIMNDKRYLKTSTNGPLSNMAVIVIVVLAAGLAVVAIPLQLTGQW